MEYIVIKNPDQATLEQLRAAVEHNTTTYKLMTTEIEKLRKVAATARNYTEDSEETRPTIETVPENNIDNDFEKEVAYYYISLMELPEDELDERVSEVLPSKRNSQQKRILMRIKAEILKNIKEIYEYCHEEGIKLADSEELMHDYLLEQKRLQLLNGFLLAENEKMPDASEDEEVKSENKIVFVPTPSGNIRVIDEIEDIDFEYYNRFLGLFQSIKDGTFKNARRFVNERSLYGLCEVKDFKTRVIFTRLNRDTYAVISAFIKKTDNDKGYQSMINSKYSAYLNQEDSIKAQLDNPEYMELQSQYEEELFRILSPSKKESPIVKEKVGDQQ